MKPPCMTDQEYAAWAAANADCHYLVSTPCVDCTREFADEHADICDGVPGRAPALSSAENQRNYRLRHGQRRTLADIRRDADKRAVRVAALYGRGYSIRAIARHVGVSRHCVWLDLQRAAA